MIYRVAKLGDLEQILSMKNKVKERVIKENLPIWLNGYPLDSMIEEDINSREGRVVTINDEIVAYAVFIDTTKEYGEYNIFETKDLQSFGRVMVKDGFTGKGIGRFLVNNMIVEAKNLNKKGMKITADNCNEKALKLYKSFGFEKEGEYGFEYAYLDIYGLYFK